MTPEDPAAINARLLQHLQRIVDEYRIQGFGYGLANAIRLAIREIDRQIEIETGTENGRKHGQ